MSKIVRKFSSKELKKGKCKKCKKTSDDILKLNNLCIGCSITEDYANDIFNQLK